MPDLREQIQEVFREVFNDPSLVLAEEMTADDIEGWDSIAHMSLIIAIEKRLKIRFAIAEISRTKEPGQNVGSLIRLVAERVSRG